MRRFTPFAGADRVTHRAEPFVVFGWFKSSL